MWHHNLDFPLLWKLWKAGQHCQQPSNNKLEKGPLTRCRGPASHPSPCRTLISRAQCPVTPLGVWVRNFSSNWAHSSSCQLCKAILMQRTYRLFPARISSRRLQALLAGQHNPSGKQLSEASRTFQISTLLDPVISPLRSHLKESIPYTASCKHASWLCL